MHQHLTVFHLHRQCRLLDGGTELVLTAADIKLPTVPGTGDDMALQATFAQGTSLVRTNAIEGIELPLDVKQSHHAVPGDDFAARARKNIRGSSDREPIQGR